MALSDRIYLDANILIRAFEGKDEISEALNRLLFHSSVPERAPFVTSSLTFAELLVLPIRNNDADLVATYRHWSRSNRYLEVVAVEGGLLLSSATLRARNLGLKLPDAIHIATAMTARCRVLLSFDRRLTGRYEITGIDHDLQQETRGIDVVYPELADIEAFVGARQNG